MNGLKTSGIAFATLALALAGCGTSYSWRSSVPENFRTVSVSVFRNESTITEIGAVMSRQLLREFQREGTFKIRRAGDSALEVQGVVKSVSAGVSAYDRKSAMRNSSYDAKAQVEITVVDKANGRVLVNNRMMTAQTTFVCGNDITTAERDASGRLADDLSRQVVDMVLGLNYKIEQPETKEKTK